MFKDFPSLHPLATHFPIVLILLAAAFQAVLVWKDWKQIRWATLLIMATAFFSALAASTIFHAEPSADAPKAAMEMFEQHEKYAWLTLWMSGITLFLKSIGIFFKINRRLYEVIVLIAAIIAAVFLSIAGHHGARLVHVAGVGPMGRYLMKEHGMGGNMNEMNDMEMKNDSVMKMNDKMPGMDSMPNSKGIDTVKEMNMKGMGNMKEMKSTDMMKDMKVMPGMGKMKNRKGIDNMRNMKDMKDMSGMDTMKNMDTMKDMKDMKDMPGMDTMKNMDTMKDMKVMPGMDSGMNMGEMKNKKMPVRNAMDTLRFPDNNPARKKLGKMEKQ
jgi:uncharacterized membrane protein